jgi:hypothetical protein
MAKPKSILLYNIHVLYALPDSMGRGFEVSCWVNGTLGRREIEVGTLLNYSIIYTLYIYHSGGTHITKTVFFQSSEVDQSVKVDRK